MSQFPGQAVATPTMETSPLKRRYFRLQAAVQRAAEWERRTGAWVQGWSLITAASFAAKLFVVPELQWRVVACIAGAQSGLVLLLWVMNAWRWKLQIAKRHAEMKILGPA